MNHTLKRLLVTLKLRKPDPVSKTQKQEWLAQTADRWHARARIAPRGIDHAEQNRIAQNSLMQPDRSEDAGSIVRQMAGITNIAYPWPSSAQNDPKIYTRVEMPIMVMTDPAKPITIDWPVRQEAIVWTPEPAPCTSSSYSNDTSSDSGSSCSASE